MPVALHIIGRRPSVFDPVPDKRRMNLFVDERGPVITHDFVRDSKVTYHVFSYKIGIDGAGSIPQGGGFNPFGEVLSGGDDPNVSVRSRPDWPNQIKPPSMERPRGAHIL